MLPTVTRSGTAAAEREAGAETARHRVRLGQVPNDAISETSSAGDRRGGSAILRTRWRLRVVGEYRRASFIDAELLELEAARDLRRPGWRVDECSDGPVWLLYQCADCE